MASEITICNLALSHLGDAATVSSIDPPEGSAQAEHCAQFYPVARDALQEMHTWGFCTRRIALASLDNPSSSWMYSYAMPNGALNLLAILAPDATDDYSSGGHAPGGFATLDGQFPYSRYTPQPYVSETLDDGTSIILTNQVQAVLRYTVQVTDPVKFSPLFTLTLSHLLASYVAGPLLKGDAGRKAALEQQQAALSLLARAQASDANQKKRGSQHNVPWVTQR